MTLGQAGLGGAIALSNGDGLFSRAAHGHGHRPVLRRGRQERAVSAARLAARRDGRADAGQRADSCRDDGGRGRLSGRAGFSRSSRPTPRLFIAIIGSITLTMAALIAVAQTDIKKVLAYSTVSQLGYMILAMGMGSWVGGMFHLITHAFFKALLFLGAGSVISRGGSRAGIAAIRRAFAKRFR